MQKCYYDKATDEVSVMVRKSAPLKSNSTFWVMPSLSGNITQSLYGTNSK